MSSQLLFRIISLIGFAGVIAGIVWAIRARLVPVAKTTQTLRHQSFEVANNLKRWRSLSTPVLLNTLLRFFYLVTLGSFLLLALTGFLPVIIFGAAVSNIALMLHLVPAPLFAIGITALALFGSQRHRFNQNDGKYLWQWLRQERFVAPPTNPNVWQKICFWLSVTLSVPIIASTVLMMYPLYGTPGQEWLLHLHGYMGLLMLVVVVLHTYWVLANQRKSLSQ